MDLEQLFERLSERDSAGDYDRMPEDWGAGARGFAGALVYALREPQRRPEHRRRIHRDVLANRDLLLEVQDVRLVDLIVWSEHVESLHKSSKRGKLSTFHFTRALEATCRRCGFELLPLMGEMNELAADWAAGDYRKTYERVKPQWE